MNYYITTSIPYVNGEPHIGHAFEFVMGDVLARVARAQGKPVLFSIGTDEHGGKVEEKAKELGIPVQKFCDEYSQKFRDLAKTLNISNDKFVRTTDPGHVQRAELIWKALAKDIYKAKYSGLYCTGCEEFITDAVAKANNNICPFHDIPYQKFEEENYFFKLSKYQTKIRELLESTQLNVVPKTRKHEILQIVRDGLEDISISRPLSSISWGIPVPGDKTQVMYVWFEALMNYLSVVGYPEHDNYKKFWPPNIQVIGKDINRFHSAIWPGMLLALGIPLPKTIYVHGFVSVEGKKMSKSLGNVINPKQIVDIYGVDAFRYYFLRHIPSYNDGDFSWQKIHDAYNGELANELGNAVSRTAAMLVQYQGGVIGNIPESGHDQAPIWQAIENCQFDRALDGIWEQVRGLNQYIDETKPWEVHKKGEKEHLSDLLGYLVSSLLNIAELLTPFLPEASGKIRKTFEKGYVVKLEAPLFPRKEETKAK